MRMEVIPKEAFKKLFENPSYSISLDLWLYRAAINLWDNLMLIEAVLTLIYYKQVNLHAQLSFSNYIYTGSSTIQPLKLAESLF